jgi:hypothetical protein
MEYYNGSLFLFKGTTVFVYDLNSEKWSKIETANEVIDRVRDSAQCFYKEKLYSILGRDSITGNKISSIYIMDLSNDEYELKELVIDLQYIAEDTFGYTCKHGILYMFGGYTTSGDLNSLAILDLNQPNLKFELLSKPINVPTSRRGHAMEVYDDQLYIFGGVDGLGNK